jgi:hypothetical protein
MSMMGPNGISEAAVKQVTILKDLPSTVFQYWPGYITFALIGIVENTVAQGLPSLGGGLVGTIYGGAVNGFFRTLDFATWDAIKATF